MTTYREHNAEALRRSNVPVDLAEASLDEVASVLPWFDDHFHGPDTDDRLMASWAATKGIARRRMVERN